MVLGTGWISWAGEVEGFVSPSGKYALRYNVGEFSGDSPDGKLVEKETGKVLAAVPLELFWDPHSTETKWAKGEGMVAIYGRMNRVGLTHLFQVKPEVRELEFDVEIPELKALTYRRWSFDSEKPIGWVGPGKLKFVKEGRVELESNAERGIHLDYEFEFIVTIRDGKCHVGDIVMKKFERRISRG